MPRKVKCRKVCHYPQTLEFLPQNNNADQEPILLTVDEYEAIRLIDRRGMSQEQCAAFMQIARTTVQRIYETARKKLADFVVEGRSLRIEGGDFQLCNGSSTGCGCVDCFKQKLYEKYKEKGEDIMRIAVTYENGEIFQHFGHTEEFKVYDVQDGTVVAGKNAHEKMYPASMTKIMTALVACEQITDPDEKVIMTIESTDYAYANDCSSAGFLVDEELTVRDLLYGTILPSGGEAAHALALHVAGSQEAFVELMNQKVEELGLSETTHFENCVGIFSKENYSTCHDMAMILKAAVENDLCREILSAKRSTTSQTAQHPEGINLSNLFLRRIEDKETGGDVLCAKTGFVNQSGSCAASYFVSKDGVPYFCVTGKSTSSWRAIYDHVYLYSTYAKTTE